MSQISTAEFRRGVTIEMNGKLYAVLSYEHNKTGRGSAQVRMKLRDVRSGRHHRPHGPGGRPASTAPASSAATCSTSTPTTTSTTS